MRAAGAALVDQDDVAVAAHAVERAARTRCTGRRRKCPGPPAIRNSGSVALFRLMAGTRATNSSILRPVGLRRGFREPERCRIGRQRQHARGMLEAAGFERRARVAALRPRTCAAKPRNPASTRSRIMRRAGYTSRAAPGIHRDCGCARKIKTVRGYVNANAPVPQARADRSAISCGPGRRASGDRCGATAGSLRAADGRARARHDAVRLRARFHAMQVDLAGREATRFAHASARRSPRRCGCARAGGAGAR